MRAKSAYYYAGTFPCSTKPAEGVTMETAKKPATFWEISAPETANYASLERDLETDIVVIGAGITGLTAALLLAKNGRQVVVIEKENIGFGTSGGNSGHLTNVVDYRYSGLAKSHGIGAARRVAKSMSAAIDKIEQLRNELDIDCNFARTPGYLYTENARDLIEIDEEFNACKLCALAVERLDDSPLPFRVAAAFRADNQAKFNPLLYLHGLASKIKGEGVDIFEHTAALEIVDGEPCVVKTTGGMIRAKEVIQATHTPLGVNIIHAELKAFRSFILAVKIAGDFPEGLYWDSASPYNYLRSVEMDGEQVVIIGGQDHKVGCASSSASHLALNEYTNSHFTVQRKVAQWSAQLYHSTDSLPFIGRSPFANHLFIGTGFSGDGLTFGTLAGMMISNLIVQGYDEYDDLYSPSRLKISGLPHLIKNNLKVVHNLVADRIFTSPEKETEATPDSGAIIRKGKDLHATSCDSSGTFTQLNAVCPHLKCVVRWNDGEKTWDCPCHGSRFGTSGEILEGPALANLGKAKTKDIK